MRGSLLPIAVVDDDDSVIKAMRRLLAAAGYHSLGFHSGREFLDGSADTPLGCVILDVCMPDLDGFAVAKRLAARAHRIPVIFMTAHDTDANRQRAGERGAVAFLTKPASENRILAAIRRALESGDEFGEGDDDRTKVP